MMFDKRSTFFTTTQHYHLWSYLPKFVTTITHQTTNMTQPPILRTYWMNTRAVQIVGLKTIVIIVIVIVTCLISMNQYSNEVGNLGMICVLFVSALRFSRGVLCRCSLL